VTCYTGDSDEPQCSVKTEKFISFFSNYEMLW